ncbi:hypothetical protein P9112_000207 [Eukaryota sp. TZLM1-RC]
MSSRLLEMAYESIRQRESQQQQPSPVRESPKKSPYPEPSPQEPKPTPISTPSFSTPHQNNEPRQPSPRKGYSARYVNKHRKQTDSKPKRSRSEARTRNEPTKTVSPKQQPAKPTQKPVRKPAPTPKQPPVKEVKESKEEAVHVSENVEKEQDRDSVILNIVQTRIEAYDHLKQKMAVFQEELDTEQESLEEVFKEILFKWSQERAQHQEEVSQLSRDLEQERLRRLKTEELLEQTRAKCTELVHQLGDISNFEGHEGESFHSSWNSQSVINQMTAQSNQVSTQSNQFPNQSKITDEQLSNREDLIEAIKSELLKEKPQKQENVNDDHPLQLIESLRKRLDAEQYERLKTEEQTASMLAAEERTIALLEAKLRSLEVQLYNKTDDVTEEGEQKEEEEKVEEVVDEVVNDDEQE